LHSVSDWPYSPCREITVQAFGSLTPFTIALLNEPEPMTWQVVEVQFRVSPQLFCAVAMAHKTKHASNARTSLGVITATPLTEIRVPIANRLRCGRQVNTLPASTIVMSFQNPKNDGVYFPITAGKNLATIVEAHVWKIDARGLRCKNSGHS